MCGFPTTYAQKIDPSATYKVNVQSNDPETTAPDFLLKVCPFNMNYASTDLDLVWGIGANYIFDNKFKIEVDYSSAYMYGLTQYKPSYDGGSSGCTAVGGNSSPNYFSIGASYFFASSVDEKDVMHTVAHYGNVNYLMKIPTNVMVLHGVKLGFIHAKTYVESGTGASLTDASGTTYTEQGDGTMLTKNILSVGYVRRSTVNLEYSVKGLGERSTKYSSELYADVLFGIGMNFSDITYYDRPVNYGDPFIVSNHNVNSTKTSSIGMRVGYLLESQSKVGWYYCGELGLMPGMAGGITGTFYMAAKIGISLNLRLKD